MKSNPIYVLSPDIDIPILPLSVIVKSGYCRPVNARRRKIVVDDDTARRRKSTIRVFDREAKHQRGTHGQVGQLVRRVHRGRTGLVKFGAETR